MSLAVPTSAREFDTSDLGVRLNSATQEAWAGLRTALLDAAGEYATPRSMTALEPGGDLRQLDAMLGVGLGSTPAAGESGGAPGSGCVVLYVPEPVAAGTAVNYAAAAHGVDVLAHPEANVQVVHTGPIDLLAHRFKSRPAPGGISIGHGNVGAGTLGCLCKGRSSPRSGRTLALSNNHVLADVNRGNLRDPFYQPGPLDGGTSQANVLGALERFVPIQFSGPNYVDCATALVDPNDVRRELVRLVHGMPQYFQITPAAVPARIGMAVGKSGRTTQLTTGRVNAVGVAITVNMGGGQIALFDNQIEIQGVTGSFCRSGDSGSLVWSWYGAQEAVGLLFAGGSLGAQSAFANPIDAVASALDIDLL